MKHLFSVILLTLFVSCAQKTHGMLSSDQPPALRSIHRFNQTVETDFNHALSLDSPEALFNFVIDNGSSTENAHLISTALSHLIVLLTSNNEPPAYESSFHNQHEQNNIGTQIHHAIKTHDSDSLFNIIVNQGKTPKHQEVIANAIFRLVLFMQ